MDLTSVAAVSSFSDMNGDFNRDSFVDAADIDLLSAAVRSMQDDVKFDLNDDGIVDADDRVVWVEDIQNTYFGDANLDGEFNSSDFVAVFRTGEYEDVEPMNSTWVEGDWNGDGDFSSRDFVAAFQSVGYENGPRRTLAVPEPHRIRIAILIIFFAWKTWTADQKRQHAVLQ